MGLLAGRYQRAWTVELQSDQLHVLMWLAMSIKKGSSLFSDGLSDAEVAKYLVCISRSRPAIIGRKERRRAKTGKKRDPKQKGINESSKKRQMGKFNEDKSGNKRSFNSLVEENMSNSFITMHLACLT